MKRLLSSTTTTSHHHHRHCHYQSKPKQSRLTSFFVGGGENDDNDDVYDDDDKKNDNNNNNSGGNNDNDDERTDATVSSVTPRRTSTSVKSNKTNYIGRNRKSKFGVCPVCDRSFPWHTLQSHAEVCVGRQGTGKGGADDESAIVDCLDSIIAHPVCEDSTNGTIIINNNNNNNDNDSPTIKHTSMPIPGLYLYENFITPEEESIILDGLDHHDVIPWKISSFNGTSYNKRWGVHCNIRDRQVVEAPNTVPLPNFLVEKTTLLHKVTTQCLPMDGCIPNEANAIDYRRQYGHWLKSHVDDRQLSKEPIANLSLAGDCIMTYRRDNVVRRGNTGIITTTKSSSSSMIDSDNNNNNRPTTPNNNEYRVLLKRRCLQIMTGQARYNYTHGIDNVDLLSDRRVSITMRESPVTKPTRTTKRTPTSTSISTSLTKGTQRQRRTTTTNTTTTTSSVYQPTITMMTTTTMTRNTPNN